MDRMRSLYTDDIPGSISHYYRRQTSQKSLSQDDEKGQTRRINF